MIKKNYRIGEEVNPLSVSTYEESLLQGLFLRGGPHYLCGKRENSAIASHGHGKGSSPEVFFYMSYLLKSGWIRATRTMLD